MAIAIFAATFVCSIFPDLFPEGNFFTTRKVFLTDKISAKNGSGSVFSQAFRK